MTDVWKHYDWIIVHWANTIQIDRKMQNFQNYGFEFKLWYLERRYISLLKHSESNKTHKLKKLTIKKVIPGKDMFEGITKCENGFIEILFNCHYNLSLNIYYRNDIKATDYYSRKTLHW